MLFVCSGATAILKNSVETLGDNVTTAEVTDETQVNWTSRKLVRSIVTVVVDKDGNPIEQDVKTDTIFEGGSTGMVSLGGAAGTVLTQAVIDVLFFGNPMGTKELRQHVLALTQASAGGQVIDKNYDATLASAALSSLSIIANGVCEQQETQKVTAEVVLNATSTILKVATIDALKPVLGSYAGAWFDFARNLFLYHTGHMTAVQVAESSVASVAYTAGGTVGTAAVMNGVQWITSKGWISESLVKQGSSFESFLKACGYLLVGTAAVTVAQIFMRRLFTRWERESRIQELEQKYNINTSASSKTMMNAMKRRLLAGRHPDKVKHITFSDEEVAEAEEKKKVSAAAASRMNDIDEDVVADYNAAVAEGNGRPLPAKRASTLPPLKLMRSMEQKAINDRFVETANDFDELIELKTQLGHWEEEEEAEDGRARRRSWSRYSRELIHQVLGLYRWNRAQQQAADNAPPSPSTDHSSNSASPTPPPSPPPASPPPQDGAYDGAAAAWADRDLSEDAKKLLGAMNLKTYEEVCPMKMK